MRILPIALLSCFTAVPLMAQNGIDEPDPFGVVGEKAGDAAEGNPAPPAKTPPAPAVEGEKAPLDAQISQHILKLAEAERDNRMSFMRIVIDDIVRLCELDEQQHERLELAAKGASERSMKEWHEQAERYFRTRLESADPDGVKEMLDGMGSVNFGGNRSEEEGESLDLWKDSLKDVLTADQVKRYESILEQRESDRIEAFASMSLSTIDDHLRLTPDQKAKISELVHDSASSYLNDVQRYWGDYFERGMLMSLVNAAEGDVLKTILTEQQFDRLRDATSNFDHFWDQKRRLKRAKEKASDRRENGEEEEAYEGAESGVLRIEGAKGIIIKGGVGRGVEIQSEEAPKEEVQ